MTLAADMWLDGWGMLVWLACAVFWVLVAVAIIALLRGHIGGGSHGGGGGGSALRILEERYARGELPRDEFLERRAVLTKPRPPGAPAPGAAEPSGSPSPSADPSQETRPLDPTG